MSEETQQPSKHAMIGEKKKLPGWVCCVCVSVRAHIEIFHASVQVSQSLTELIVHRFAAEELPNPAPALQVLFLRSINQDRSLS
jgi:hypothetical protein